MFGEIKMFNAGQFKVKYWH